MIASKYSHRAKPYRAFHHATSLWAAIDSDARALAQGNRLGRATFRIIVRDLPAHSTLRTSSLRRGLSDGMFIVTYGVGGAVFRSSKAPNSPIRLSWDEILVLDPFTEVVETTPFTQLGSYAFLRHFLRIREERNRGKARDPKKQDPKQPPQPKPEITPIQVNIQEMQQLMGRGGKLA